MRKAKQYKRGEFTYVLVSLGGFQILEQTTHVFNLMSDLTPLFVAIAKKDGQYDVKGLRLDWKSLEPLMLAFASGASIRGPGGDQTLSDQSFFDEHFSGDLDGILELFTQSMELNFSDFLEKRFGVNLKEMKKNIMSLVEEAKKKNASASNSQEQSTGTDGELLNQASVQD